jgi:hypothetical protein
MHHPHLQLLFFNNNSAHGTPFSSPQVSGQPSWEYPSWEPAIRKTQTHHSFPFPRPQYIVEEEKKNSSWNKVSIVQGARHLTMATNPNSATACSKYSRPLSRSLSLTLSLSLLSQKRTQYNQTLTLTEANPCGRTNRVWHAHRAVT